MRARGLTLVLSLALCVNAFAQVLVDEFNGGFNPALPWSWLVVSYSGCENPPDTCNYVNTENSDYPYRFVDGKLEIVMHPWNSTFNQWNFAANFPNLPVRGFNSGWAIETEVMIDLRGNIPPANTYSQAGIMLMRDMNNYYQTMLIIMPPTDNEPHKFWLSTAHEVNCDYQYGGASAGYWGDGQQSFSLKLRLEDGGVDASGTPLIKVRVQLPNWTDFVDVWPSPFPRPQIVGEVAQNGGRLALYNVAGFTGNPQPVVSFSYIRLENIRLGGVIPGDVNGDGCVDDADLLNVLFSFGSTGEELPADINRDCFVDDADLLSVLFNFGTGC